MASRSRERGHFQALLPWQLKGFPKEKVLFRFMAGMSLAAAKEPPVRDQPRARNVGTAAGAGHTQRMSRIYHVEGKKEMS